MARPSFKVTNRIKKRVYELSRTGISEEQIAKRIHISLSTFKTHKKLFLSALKKGRAEYAVYQDEVETPLVENALVKRAKGFEFDEVQTKQDGQVVNGKLMNGKITKTVTKKFIPPDTGAAIFYLSNRSKVRWQNPMKIEIPPDGDEKKVIPIVSRIPKLSKPENEPPSN